ncbi:ABC transporter permease [Actinosynnema sp. NPDC047251]|uniref:Transport permease protein n=1 Tax=Saccharothrix espanaensis (strain ATCC 51144 / DSM 44229 / JCM 9112 / NBRC 15066 / NRRL 15764) TaxID=1179773 RepID=K0JVK1_SACES|nr:ABC transporter permease [Saccharothrix espanaensis]CCH31890.1 ABC-2 type transporter [Saccharothrix espanaensis DSM 44229]
MSTLGVAFHEGAVVAKRNLRMIVRVPDLLVNAAVAPIMMTLLFGFIIGGAIDLDGASYREYLMDGIFVQAVLFSAVNTGTVIASDITTGIVDRLRSMPISRSAVLFGRTSSDVVNNLVVVLVTAVLGLIIGWRVRTSLVDALLGFVVLLVFAYALSWLMAVVGLAMRAPEAVSSVGFTIAIPLGFLSNAYVPIHTMPGVIQPIAEWNPISAVVQALRDLFGNMPASAPRPDAWPLQNPVTASLLWIVVLLALFIPLAIRQYWKAVAR